ncbi:sugar transporter st1, partial [Cystoisospora suis]
MYLSEILPKDSRGTFLSSFFLLQLFGSLTARALLPADSIQAAKVAQHLAYVGGLGAVAVGALFLVLLVLVPESPRWLLQRQRKARALRALEMLGESSMEAGAIVVQQSEIYLPHRLLVRGGGATQAADGEGLCTRLFSSHGLDFAGVLACVLAAVFVGGESIFFFSGDLIGAVICDNRLSLLAVSIAKVLGGISCILVVDSWGRRPLLCFGTSVAATGYFFLMMGYLWGGAGSPVSRFGFPSSSSTIAPSQACSFIPGDEGGSGLLYFFPTVFYFLGLLFVVFGLSSSWIPLLYLLVCELIPTCVRGVAVGMCLSLFFFLKATSLLLLGSTLFQSYAGA